MPLTALKSEVKISKNVFFREMEGEAVLLNVQTGVYFGLDSTGTAIWQILEKKSRLDQVLKAMLQDYEIDEDTCRADLLKFVSSLEKNGLLEVHEN